MNTTDSNLARQVRTVAANLREGVAAWMQRLALMELMNDAQFAEFMEQDNGLPAALAELYKAMVDMGASTDVLRKKIVERQLRIAANGAEN